MQDIEITLPHKYRARDYQEEFWYQMNVAGKKRACLVWHRRAGKDLTIWNYVIQEAFMNAGNYFYIFPSYAQGRKVIWDGKDKNGNTFLSYIPTEILYGSPNNTMMQVRIACRPQHNADTNKYVGGNHSLIQVIGSDNFDCYDDKTEILTESGWVLFKGLNKNDRVATLNPETRLFEWQKPTDYHSYNYSGKMYCVQNRSLDFCVTPNHMFYVKSGKGVYKFKAVSDSTIGESMIPSTCSWVGESPKTILGFDTGWFVKFLGTYLAEGSTFQNKKTNRVVISQVNAAKKEKIIALLKEKNFSIVIHKANIHIENKVLCDYCKNLGTSEEKYIPKDILNLSPEHLKVLFEWMVMGDGYKGNGSTYYYSCSKNLIDGVQELLIKIGLSGNISVKQGVGHVSCIEGRNVYAKRDLYQVRVRTSQFKRFRGAKYKNYVHQVDYDGGVYCVSVPNRVVKVRRNGKECWSGNSVMGTSMKGAVFSEYSLQDPKAWQYIRPILTETGGWAIFCQTPRGYNHGKELYDMALQNRDWFCQKLTVEDTVHDGERIISDYDIDSERRAGMSEDYIQQEFYCSFNMGIDGSYYGWYLEKARAEGRITSVPWQPQIPVHVAMDLGIGDATAVTFYQLSGQEVHIIDYYENQGRDFAHYAKVLKEKPYVYGKYYAPHDARSKSLSTGLSVEDVSRSLEIPLTILPTLQITVENGIEAARSIFPRIWIDEKKCDRLIKCIGNYQKIKDEKNNVYKDVPLHNYASHGADSLRYCALAVKMYGKTTNAIDDREYQNMINKYLPKFN